MARLKAKPVVAEKMIWSRCLFEFGLVDVMHGRYELDSEIELNPGQGAASGEAGRWQETGQSLWAETGTCVNR